MWYYVASGNSFNQESHLMASLMASDVDYPDCMVAQLHGLQNLQAEGLSEDRRTSKKCYKAWQGLGVLSTTMEFQPRMVSRWPRLPMDIPPYGWFTRWTPWWSAPASNQ